MQEKNLVKPQVKVAMDRWPTLEILPGGVIRHAMKPEGHAITKQILEKSSLDKMYACAICSDSYRDLYSLVKHVKCHQVDKKMKDNAKIGKLFSKTFYNSNSIASIESISEGFTLKLLHP